MLSNIDKCVHLFYTSPMKLSQYAKQQGISYPTALRWFGDGAMKGYRAPSGTIIVTERAPVVAPQCEQEDGCKQAAAKAAVRSEVGKMLAARKAALLRTQAERQMSARHGEAS
jgi:hypothetical protein